MPNVAGHRSSLRRARQWGVATLGLLAGVALGIALIQVQVRHARGEESTRSATATDDRSIPDDTVLQEELQKAIDLRRREHFDRVLDARDPGELVEHATLTDAALDRHLLGIDALF